MKIVFAGTPEFASQALEALINAGHRIELVLTQPDKPSGRGMKLTPCPVKNLALGRGLELIQPASLKKDLKAREAIASTNADLMVVAAYGIIIPGEILEIPRYGAINLHASILPRWRGAAPIQRAIMAGDEKTGITLMQMDEGLDTGNIIRVIETPILDNETAGSLHDRLATIGAESIVELLKSPPVGKRYPSTAQDNESSTYATKIEKTEAILHWNLPAKEILRKIRAYNPYPGSSCKMGDSVVKIWDACIAEGNANPGQILEADKNGIVVSCAKDAILIRTLQKAGGKKLDAAQFLAGNSLKAGTVLE